MAICSICSENRKLTREHTIPLGLLKRLEKLPQDARPNLVWTPQMTKMVTDENHTVNDMCEECQGLFSRAYDNRVNEAFDAMMDLQEGPLPVSITVEEPWFTLYLLRIFWNCTRASKIILLDAELTKPIIDYAKNPKNNVVLPNNYCLGVSCFPAKTYPNDMGGHFSSVFYAGISPDKRLCPNQVRVKQLYMRFIGIRFLYMQASNRHANNFQLQQYYALAVRQKNGVLLQPNSYCKTTYTFSHMDPDASDNRNVRIVKGMIAGKTIDSLA